MKTQYIATDRVLLFTILAIIIFNLFSRRCSKTISEEKKSPITTIVRDTIWQTKVDTFKVQTLRYQTVYVNKEDTTSTIAETLPQKNDTTTLIKAKAYRDTLHHDDIDIFSYNLVDGQLLDSEISYKLKVPREITVTKTIEHPKTYRSGLYLFSEVGGHQNAFNNISLGLQYNRKGKWLVSYRTNLNQLQQPTHHIGVGIRLFK